MAGQVNLDSWVAEDQERQDSEEFASDLEQLGPTFVKLGQLLSTRADILSEDYVHALERLQDDVDPLPFDAVEAVIVEELGSSSSVIFQSIDKAPLASASLGQVHRARLHTGEEVIIKVQRPAIQERVKQELKVLAEVSSSLEKHSTRARRYRLNEIVEELSRSLKRELDYRMEAQNLLKMNEQLEDSELIFAPIAYPKYSTSRVLTMSYVEGQKLPKTTSDSSAGFLGTVLADELFRVYLTHVLLDGLYHADPHPGNILITPEGRICLLDLGMIGNMPGSLQIVLARLLVAVTEKNGEAAAETALDVSERAEDANVGGFRRQITELVASYHQQPLSEVQAGKLILDITQAAGENGILVPYELTMLAKTLMNLDEIGRRLDPTFNPTKALEKHTGPILEKRLKQDLSPKLLLDAYLEARTFLQDGPRLANNILKDLERGTFKVRVDAVDERELLVSFQKIANRIGMSLIIGFLILGASILMSANVGGPVLFGYPAFAVVAFILAAGGGVWMVVNIHRQDRDSSKELDLELRKTG